MNKTRRLMSLWLILVMIFFILPGILFIDAPDEPPEKESSGESDRPSVLFDTMHGQTAGQADWVVDGAFSDFAEAIQAEGFDVEELQGEPPFQIKDLDSHDVFVIPEANIPFKKEEQDAMITYVENGGSIFFISNHYNADRNKNRWDSSEIMNGYRRGAFDDPVKGMNEEERNSEAMQDIVSSDWLSKNFGVRFRYNALGTVTENQIVEPSEAFSITEGVHEMTMHAGSTLAITDPERAKGIVYLPENLDESDSWEHAPDKGVYHGGGIDEGPYVAISKPGKGKAAFLGDSSPVEGGTPKYRTEETGEEKTTHNGFQEADNEQLLLNLIQWLAEDGAAESLADTEIPLDEPSPLLEKEIPENATEPEPEPWTKSVPGYKWYDFETFAPGSFGSDEEPEQSLDYSLKYKSTVPNDEPFPIEVVAEGFEAGEIIDGFNLGMFLDGGEQIAKIQRNDGIWPEDYGYSESFALEANEDGEAVRTFNVKVNQRAQGDVNLRLRQGEEHMVTERVTVGE